MRNVSRNRLLQQHNFLQITPDLWLRMKITNRGVKQTISIYCRGRKKIKVHKKFFSHVKVEYKNCIKNIAGTVVVFRNSRVYLNKDLNLKRHVFDCMIEKTKVWLEKNEQVAIGEKKLYHSYKSGDFCDSVFCFARGKHWKLSKYIRSVLCPLMLQKEVISFNCINSALIHNIFDYGVSAYDIFNQFHEGLKQSLTMFLDSKRPHEIESMMCVNKPTFFGEKLTYDLEMALITVEQKTGIVQNWFYFQPNTWNAFSGNGSLGWSFLVGNFDWIKKNFTGLKVKYPVYIIKSYQKLGTGVLNENSVEFGVFQCRWVKCIIRQNNKVLSVSPLLDISTVVNNVTTIVKIDPSLCSCSDCVQIRVRLLNQRTLQSLCAALTWPPLD